MGTKENILWQLSKRSRLFLPKEFWVGDKNASVSLVEFGDYESEGLCKSQRGSKKITGRI